MSSSSSLSRTARRCVNATVPALTPLRPYRWIRDIGDFSEQHAERMELRQAQLVSRRSTSRLTAVLVGVMILGLLLRLIVVAAGQGGISTSVHPGLDESVYVGGAWLFRQGSLPYRDFVFVFPPGFIVLLLPIVQLASWLGGPALAVTMVRTLAACVGALNVWLIGRIGTRWVGAIGGLTAALIYATMPIVVRTEASALQEPFVNLAVLVAAIVWARRGEADRSVGPLISVGLLVGVAISIKLIVGAFLIPLLIAGPFFRPAADRIRLLAAACVPLALTGAAFALVVGWRPVFDQAVAAQVLRGRGGEGLSRVDSLLPLLRGRFGVAAFLGPGAWIAVVIFGVMCAAAIWRGGRGGRLWGGTGLTFLVVLMALPSYYPHYAVLLAPAAALIVAWVLTALAFVAERRLVPTVVTAALLALLIAVVFVTQTATTVDALPIRIGDFGAHLRQLIDERGPPEAGTVSRAIQRVPARSCIVAVRPQLLLDVDRVPSADRHGHVLLDVYGSALLAARDEGRRSGETPDAAVYATVQTDILTQSRSCARIVFSRRSCARGRKDISATTQAKLESSTRLVARYGCIELRRRPSGG
jgi:hypothetical protein